jgi:hypothetical protein
LGVLQAKIKKKEMINDHNNLKLFMAFLKHWHVTGAYLSPTQQQPVIKAHP